MRVARTMTFSGRLSVVCRHSFFHKSHNFAVSNFCSSDFSNALINAYTNNWWICRKIQSNVSLLQYSDTRHLLAVPDFNSLMLCVLTCRKTSNKSAASGNQWGYIDLIARSVILLFAVSDLFRDSGCFKTMLFEFYWRWLVCLVFLWVSVQWHDYMCDKFLIQVVIYKIYCSAVY